MRKSTLVVLALAVAAAAWLWFVELKKESPRDRLDDEFTPAFTFAAADIASITITRGEETVVLERRGDRWVITQPIETRADANTAASLASTLAGASIRRTLVPDPERLAEYGLAPPAVVVALRLATGEEHRIELGVRDFAGTAVYARIDGAEEIALLPGTALASADKSLDELRDRSVLGFATWEVTGFELRAPAGRFRVTRAENQWRLEEPVADLADSSEATALLSAVSSARFEEIVAERAEDLRRYGLARPRIELRVRTDRGEELALSVGSRRDDEYFARDAARPMVFTIPRELAEQLDTSLFALRDKRPVRLVPEDLRRVELRRGDAAMIFEMGAEERWRVAGAEAEVHREKVARVTRIFAPLETARAEEIADRPPAAVLARLERPAAVLLLTDDKGETLRIELSEPVGDSVWLRTSARAPVFRVGKSALERLPTSLDELLEDPTP